MPTNKRRRVTRTPIARFRLYPERHALFAVVNVWPNAASMRAHAVRHGDTKSAARTTHAYCSPYTVWRKGRTTPEFVELNFYRQALSMRIVTHELFHATIAWGRRVGFDFARFDADDSINADEERITHVHSELCNQFMKRAIAAKLYEPMVRAR